MDHIANIPEGFHKVAILYKAHAPAHMFSRNCLHIINLNTLSLLLYKLCGTALADRKEPPTLFPYF
jgi:hypothetical protein